MNRRNRSGLKLLLCAMMIAVLTAAPAAACYCSFFVDCENREHCECHCTWEENERYWGCSPGMQRNQICQQVFEDYISCISSVVDQCYGQMY